MTVLSAVEIDNRRDNWLNHVYLGIGCYYIVHVCERMNGWCIYVLLDGWCDAAAQ